MQPSIAFALSALAAASTTSAALSQPAPDRPWSVEGALEDSDRQDSDQHRYDEHRLRLETGQRYRITARSEAFDTRISLTRAGEAQPIAENDDFGGELNSGLTIAPTASGEYVLRILAFAEEGRGAYSARAETLPPIPPPITAAPSSQSSTSWSLWEGELSATDADRDNNRSDDYLVRMRAGQTRLISVESAAFDPIVSILRPDALEGEAIDGDDDAGPGYNALVGFRPEADGDYVVRVSSYSAGGLGAYRLRISGELTPPQLVGEPPADEGGAD